MDRVGGHMPPFSAGSIPHILPFRAGLENDDSTTQVRQGLCHLPDIWPPGAEQTPCFLFAGEERVQATHDTREFLRLVRLQLGGTGIKGHDLGPELTQTWWEQGMRQAPCRADVGGIRREELGQKVSRAQLQRRWALKRARVVLSALAAEQLLRHRLPDAQEMGRRVGFCPLLKRQVGVEPYCV